MEIEETTLDPSDEIESEEQHLTDPWYFPQFTHTVVLADETTLNGSAALDADADCLWIWLDEGPTLAEAFMTFSDPEKTKTVISHTTSMETYSWEGYTEVGLIKIINGQVTIQLKKERK